MPRPTSLSVWRDLTTHSLAMSNVSMRELFARDEELASGEPNRFERFSCSVDDLLLDYSKNRVSDETMDLLFRLADEAGVFETRDRMFRGERINCTENRAVLHTALRAQPDSVIAVEGDDRNVVEDIQAVLARMRAFVEEVRSGERVGCTGNRFTDVVNIGIGGSDLGPVMVTEALRPWASEDIRAHFVSNVDATDISEVLKELHAESTLFIVASKTFTTLETMTNAESARDWLLQRVGVDPESAVAAHFVALSTAVDLATEFGVAQENIFGFWDFVGGRYSLWSAIGLSIALSIGWDGFERLLRGARRMDENFIEAEPRENVSLILALLGVWYSNFHGANVHAVIPYDQYLHRLPAYLSQLDMESNGKRVTRDGQPVDDPAQAGGSYTTGPVLFGEPGTNGQHSFFQLLHQGTQVVPVDFLAPLRSQNPIGDHHDKLLANLFAQSEALMRGRTETEARAELEADVAAGKLEAGRVDELIPHKVFPGNRPSNTILFQELSPETLGAIVAMYEHKVFVQGVIWNINSFDQFGVELGKNLASVILKELEDDGPIRGHDSSTSALIQRFRDARVRG